ncbi:YezD family protein [Effusibacillus pohliae]|uniref:YezD family protein n=1 Tax=Effusibacillus pohliae TaxID=232270 RepID=UPI000361283B|nr:YezD family protein [Effusibacillus pohliae]
MSEKTIQELRDSRLETILNALEGLEYGTLQIIVHDSQITQIERTEKKRFPLQRVQRSEQAGFSGHNNK